MSIYTRQRIHSSLTDQPALSPVSLHVYLLLQEAKYASMHTKKAAIRILKRFHNDDVLLMSLLPAADHNISFSYSIKELTCFSSCSLREAFIPALSVSDVFCIPANRCFRSWEVLSSILVNSGYGYV